jgi:hypothetical protein
MTATLRDLLIDALRDVDAHPEKSRSDAPETKAATVALVLSWIENYRGTPHPIESWCLTDAPVGVEVLADEHPWIDAAWRQQAAINLLAGVICKAVTKAGNSSPAALSEVEIALQVIADQAAVPLPNRLSVNCTGDDLKGLALLAADEADLVPATA